MMSEMRFSIDTWVSKDVVVPLRSSEASGGVGVRNGRLDIFMRQFLARAEGGAEAFAKVSQMGDGFALETVLVMEIPKFRNMTAENLKPMRITVAARNIEQVEIAESEFAIPADYRRVE
jgi:hypothetical protein